MDDLIKQDPNPMYISVTQDGAILTPEEAKFIYYYIVTRNALEAFKQAGFKYPRKPLSQAQRRKLIREGRAEAIAYYNSDIYDGDDCTENLPGEEPEEIEDYEGEDIELTEEGTEETKNKPGQGGDENRENTPKKHKKIYEKQLYQYNKILKQSKKMSEEEYNIAATSSASNLLGTPHIKSEVLRRLHSIESEQVATAHEVFAYFTSVMRGQVLDQFGLEAPLSERTRAAECLAKRLIDMPKQLEARGNIGGNSVQLIIEPRREPDIIEGSYTEID